MIPCTPSSKTGPIGPMLQKSGPMIRGMGAGALPLKSNGCKVSGPIGPIGPMFSTYAYAREKEGFGAVKFFLARSLKISALSALSALKGFKAIEKTGKVIARLCCVIGPRFLNIGPIGPDQINRLADLVVSGAKTTTYGKGAV